LTKKKKNATLNPRQRNALGLRAPATQAGRAPRKASGLPLRGQARAIFFKYQLLKKIF